MARKLTFKKNFSNNYFKPFVKAFSKDAEQLPMRIARFTRVRARSIMKKAPQKARSVYGGYVFRRKKTYERQRREYSQGKRKQRPSATYFRKGMYSKPGSPPYWHAEHQSFNLRFILFKRIYSVQLQIPSSAGLGKRLYAWRVGPKYNQHFGSMPVPQLHEYGGRMRLGGRSRGGTEYQTKIPTYRRRRFFHGQLGVAIYPARPYMAPAFEEATEKAQTKGSPDADKKLLELGLRNTTRRLNLKVERVATSF